MSLAKSGKHQEKGWPNSAYSASKVGVSALTAIQQRAFDDEEEEGGGRHDVAVNHVHPGYVQTGMTGGRGNK